MRVPFPARLVIAVALSLGCASIPVIADPSPAETVKRPAGATVVPERFVRRWDPVTIFFDSDAGPANGGPETNPGRLVTMTPAQPGAFTWLNAHTLQFRPAEPWPALGLTTWKIGDKSSVLATLLPATIATIPEDGATGLTGVDSVTLTFDQEVDPKALGGMLDVALTPLPGFDRNATRHLAASDFMIKMMERAKRDDNASYVVELRQPVPPGMQVEVKLALSSRPGLDITSEKISFSTADAFRPLFAGCADRRVPISPQGVSYAKEDALSCKTETEVEKAAGTTRHHHHHEIEQATGDDSGSTTPDMAGNDAEPSDDAQNADTETASDDTGTQDSDNTPKAHAEVDSGEPQGELATTSKDNPATGSIAAAPVAPTLSAKRELVVQFSTPLKDVDPVQAGNLIRISPAVKGVKTHIVGDQLYLSGKFSTDTLYQITLTPTKIKDTLDRELVMEKPSTVYVSWPTETPFLTLSYGNGTVESLGPKMVPLRGRGFAQADVRIHAIDPLDRSYWPFPDKALTVSEDERPPSPGEEVKPFDSPFTIDPSALAQQIARMGSPSVSELMKLPLTPYGTSARFGLDLAPALERIAGKDKPGTYLVGIRPLDKGKERQWMRVQVTDLSLTTVEEEQGVRFLVTSLSTGLPVPDASIRIEGNAKSEWKTVASGATAPDGHFTWDHPPAPENSWQLYRIAVTKGDDVLVVDPAHAPDRYSSGNWFPGGSDWLGWMHYNLAARHPAPKMLCHLFTERPIYRPTDPVEIKAYVRQLYEGALTPGGKSGMKSEIVVTGPDNAEWRYPVAISDNGGMYYHFDETTNATGVYDAHVELDGKRCGANVAFKKDAYRLPKFQVRLDAPKTIPLDKAASIGMTATYYAGGAAADRPVRWRVTQFPYAFTPKPREGFVYATDTRYAAATPVDSAAVIERQDKTDKEGRAKLDLDPTREKTGQPRRYVVEATVTGDDDKTVTNTEEVVALPAFVLGLKVPRYIEHATSIPVEALMVDGNGNSLSGKQVTVRVLQRQWSSILQASDFSEGKPKYRTEVVDEKRLEKTLTTAGDSIKLDVPVAESGVYIVEVEASDDLGRRQTVSTDLFIGGGEPVTWSRPPSQVFKVTTDKASYVPGETATMVLQSPFQVARAVAIVETPDGKNSYQWLDVKNGYGEFKLPIDKTYLPRVPVHFALMRGRLGNAPAASGIDLRRPQTLAATAWVGVKPTKNIVTVKIDSPDKAQPGDTVDVTVHLTDDQNKPIPGEVTLWLIDQAVLALAKEAPLDPLPAFIRDRGTHLAFSDTRNSIFGSLPLDEDPGGDVGEGDQALLNKVTLRKNFNPMPYYNPSLMVDATGTAKVSIKLPDNLTVYKIRAKAITGPDRFGFATGQVAARLPVIVEPNLPRFVRPGDAFALSAIGRVVEGEGGPGKAEVKVDGLDLPGGKTKDVSWQPNHPERFDFDVTVPTPAYNDNGEPVRKSVSVTLGVERTSDKARDAFQVDLPIQPDRRPDRTRQLITLTDSKPVTIPGFDAPTRPGTVKHSLLVSNEPGLVRLMAGLTYLQQYPYGCSEQRISLARAEIASKQFAAALMSDQKTDRAAFTVKQTLEWISSATDEDGLVAFWPGSKGDVMLTAWTVEMMVEAKKAGFPVDDGQRAVLTRALKQALRSDYAHFLSGEAYNERAWALSALAEAGELDSGYAAELLRKKDYISLEGLAQIRQALATSSSADPMTLKALDDAIWKGIVIKQRDGQPVYGGLQDADPRNPVIFPSETRTVSEVLRAVSLDTTPSAKRAILVDALVTLGQGDGWGTTNANAEAMLALSQYMGTTGTQPDQGVYMGYCPNGKPCKQQVALATVNLGGSNKLQRVTTDDQGHIDISSQTASVDHPVTVQSDLTYLPAEDGSHVAAKANGFVVTRESDKVDPTGAPAKKQRLDQPGQTIALTVGDVVEDSLEIVTPEDRHHVAIVVPLAAGMEPLNPELATAPPEAKPSAEPTLKPTYVAFLDDQIAYFYETLPKGTYDFHFRTKANIPGKFIQPAAYTEMMYNEAVNGNGAGATVTIGAADQKP